MIKISAGHRTEKYALPDLRRLELPGIVSSLVSRNLTSEGGDKPQQQVCPCFFTSSDILYLGWIDKNGMPMIFLWRTFLKITISNHK